MQLFCFLFSIFLSKAHIFSKGESCSGKHLIQTPSISLESASKPLRILNISSSRSAPNLSAHVCFGLKPPPPREILPPVSFIISAYCFCFLSVCLLHIWLCRLHRDMLGNVSQGRQTFLFHPGAAQLAESGSSYRLLEETWVVFLPGERHHCNYC